MKNLAPIVLIVYNRPQHTRLTVEALQQNTLAKDSELFVFSDAPKSEAAVESVNEVRKYIRTISGFKVVHIKEQIENIGCDQSIINSINTIFLKYNKIIEIEDDIVTAPLFLNFMNEALDSFENDERIWSVSGYTPSVKISPKYTDDIYLSLRPLSWGFGTWKNRWDAIDRNIDISYESIVNNSQKKKIMCAAGEDIFGTMLKHPNTYDIPIFYYMRMNSKYTVAPVLSLVKNIGIDGTGEHFTNVQNKYATDIVKNKETININPDVQPNKQILKTIKQFYTKPLWRKTLIYITKKIKIYDFLRRHFE